MGALLGLVYVVLFSLVNLFLWGNHGFSVHLLGMPVPAYSLVWLWIALIAVIYGANYAVDGKANHPICHIIGTWWTANIAMTTLLNYFNYRGIEEAGEMIFEMPGLVLDFGAQGMVDLISIAILWMLIKQGRIRASIWNLLFCGYLVTNLFGHTAGAYNLWTGVDATQTAEIYDSYMYLTFTIMLVLQAIGSSGDALLRWIGSDVDLFADIRPYVRRIAHRNFHLY